MILLANNMTPSMETVHVKSQQQKGSSHLILNAYSLDVYIDKLYKLYTSYLSQVQFIVSRANYAFVGCISC